MPSDMRKILNKPKELIYNFFSRHRIYLNYKGAICFTPQSIVASAAKKLNRAGENFLKVLVFAKFAKPIFFIMTGRRESLSV